MKTTHLAISTLVLLGAASLANHASGQALTAITEWNFNNDAVAVNTGPASSTGTGNAATIGFNTNYNGTQSTDTSDVNAGTPLSSDPGTGGVNNQWRIRGGDGTASPGTGNNGWSSNAPIGSQGAQFLASTVGFSNVQVSFDWSPTAQGEGKLQLQYTLNGSTYNNVAANLFTASGGTMTLTNTASANTVVGGYLQATSSAAYMNGITANLSSIAGAANNPNFGIRLVSASTGADDTNVAGAALNNTSGNWRFDEVTISGAAATTVPEPSSYVLAGVGLIGLGAFARRSKLA